MQTPTGRRRRKQHRPRAAEVLQPSPICSLFSLITKGEGSPNPPTRAHAHPRAQSTVWEDYTELELLRRRAAQLLGTRASRSYR